MKFWHFYSKKRPFYSDHRETRSRFFWHEKREVQNLREVEKSRRRDETRINTISIALNKICCGWPLPTKPKTALRRNRVQTDKSSLCWLYCNFTILKKPWWAFKSFFNIRTFFHFSKGSKKIVHFQKLCGFMQQKWLIQINISKHLLQKWVKFKNQQT